jgi:hypothetical protein
MIDFFGHLAYAALALGTWLVGKRLTLGWALRAAGSATWLVLGVVMAMSSIWFWSAVFLATDLAGFYRWKRKQDEKQN